MPTKKQYWQAARRMFNEEGTLEIDDFVVGDGQISQSTDGAYVKAWVFVYDDEAEKEEG